MTFAESELEEAVLEWLRGLNYDYVLGQEIAPDGERPERKDYREVILKDRLQRSLTNINPRIPQSAINDALVKIGSISSASIIESNYAFHRMLSEGVDVEYKRKDGTIAGDKVYLIDFEDVDNNEFLAVNQFTIHENDKNRRPDVIIFINGLPIVVIELKNPADEKATIWSAFNQLQTYKKDIPSLFHFNELLIVSDGYSARIGSLTADKERFMPWRTIDGDGEDKGILNAEILTKGVLHKDRLLDLVRNFIVFEEDAKGNKIKKIAGYHQFHAVNKAIETTVSASATKGDKRAGVVWHTQGSGKSLTMAFYAGKIIQDHRMENPTLVVITDRNDLDDQLFGTFSSCKDLLRQNPRQAGSREELIKLLAVASGGVIFTTVHKFFPENEERKYPLLSDRRNIVVIADEAHRSQYDFIDGFARHMRDALPNASFIGFTGTPIELEDRNTRHVFGDYIDVYDIQQAVEDGATVRIFYESRMTPIELPESKKALLDHLFDEATESEEIAEKEKYKHRRAVLEALVGSEKRIKVIAKDLVDHFEKRQNVMQGKAMIVCMSRRICVDLYNEIVRIRPDWGGTGISDRKLNVVMTGSAADPLEWQDHIHNKAKREELANRFKDPNDPFQIVIVRDMWLTGFDVPCLHTMYVDKPMQGHGLMQAIARVNRVFRDKQGGLIVDYIGLADQLKKALSTYVNSGGRGKAVIDQHEAVEAMLEKYEICQVLMSGYDWSWWEDADKKERLDRIIEPVNFIMRSTEEKDRFKRAAADLTKAFSLAVPLEEALAIQDDVGFFQSVKVGIVKTEGDRTAPTDVDFAIRQIISSALVTDQVIDIFEAAGIDKPDIGILSEEFLAQVQKVPQKNLAAELLRRLLKEHIRNRARTNVTESRKFSAILEETISRYEKRMLDTVEFIEILIGLAKEMGEAIRRGEELNLSVEEVAFYDALETNDSAVKVLGDEVLRSIAVDIASQVRSNMCVDWAVRESARARMRVAIKRVLRQYGYPPDKQEKATMTVIEQAELLCGELAS